MRLIEERLHREGLTPWTVGRNTFSSDAPLKAITDLMESCAGVVVIALERSWFPSGLDKRGGPRERRLEATKLPTPWNHIEAAMACVRHLPLLVIVEAGLKAEGLLEPGYDWHVQSLPLGEEALHTKEFNGVFADWKEKVLHPPRQAFPTSRPRPNPADLSLGELVNGLKPVQLWSALIAVAGLLAGTFSLALWLAPVLEKGSRTWLLTPAPRPVGASALHDPHRMPIGVADQQSTAKSQA